MIGLLLTLEFLSCQFDMFFCVFRLKSLPGLDSEVFFPVLILLWEVVVWFVTTGVSQHFKGFCGSFGIYCQTIYGCLWLQETELTVWDSTCGTSLVLTDPHEIVWFHKLLPFTVSCFVNWRHKLAATAISMWLHLQVNPSYRKHTTLFLNTKGKYTGLLPIFEKKPPRTKGLHCSK